MSEDQIQTITEIAEKTARDYIHSKMPRRGITDLEITVEAAGSKPLTVTVDVYLNVSRSAMDCDAKQLTSEATQKAFEAVERHLEELKCKSTT